LLSSEIHVWRAALDEEPDAAGAGTVLSEHELERAGRFRFERDRRRFAAARRALRGILAGYVGEAPERLRFAEGEHGKPVLAWPAGSDVRFNVTHSDALALCAVSRGREVGVDVEALRALPDADALARRFFAPGERADIERQPAERRLESFFSCWTRKEAYLKALGCGLLKALDSFEVAVAPGDVDCRLRVPGEPAEESRWSLLALDVGPGFVAAVAGDTQPWTVVRWSVPGVRWRETVAG
jgi:4'-phosphopantetheinyl transferase